MLLEEGISERNGLLIEFITAIDVGIHLIDMVHTPKLISYDYTTKFSAYCKNFHLILLKGTSDEIHLDIRLKPIKNMDIDDLKPKFLEWMVLFDHAKIYTLGLRNTNLFVVGFNHHNKVLKTNPYPVFSFYDPITYYDLERAENTQKRFDKYDLVIS